MHAYITHILLLWRISLRLLLCTSICVWCAIERPLHGACQHAIIRSLVRQRYQHLVTACCYLLPPGQPFTASAPAQSPRAAAVSVADNRWINAALPLFGHHLYGLRRHSESQHRRNQWVINIYEWKLPTFGRTICILVHEMCAKSWADNSDKWNNLKHTLWWTFSSDCMPTVRSSVIKACFKLSYGAV